MYANFYNRNDKCLFSVEVQSETHASKVADFVYKNNQKVEDWTITDEAIGKVKDIRVLI